MGVGLVGGSNPVSNAHVIHSAIGAKFDFPKTHLYKWAGFGKSNSGFDPPTNPTPIQNVSFSFHVFIFQLTFSIALVVEWITWVSDSGFDPPTNPTPYKIKGGVA